MPDCVVVGVAGDGHQGLRDIHVQKFETVAGTVAMVTAVLTGSTAGLLAAVLSQDLVWVSVTVGVVVAAAAFALLIRFETAAWRRAYADIVAGEPAQESGPHHSA